MSVDVPVMIKFKCITKKLKTSLTFNSNLPLNGMSWAPGSFSSIHCFIFNNLKMKQIQQSLAVRNFTVNMTIYICNLEVMLYPMKTNSIP